MPKAGGVRGSTATFHTVLLHEKEATEDPKYSDLLQKAKQRHGNKLVSSINTFLNKHHIESPEVVKWMIEYSASCSTGNEDIFYLMN